MFACHAFTACSITAGIQQALPLLQYQAAQTAQRIVMWYVARVWSLCVLLIALPLAVLVTGWAILLHSWKEEAELRQHPRLPFRAIWAHKATLVVAVTTLTAGVVLAVVVVHMLMN
jgi:hypothetical protein